MYYKALRADKSNIEEKDLKKWLVVVCINAAKDHLRAKRKLHPQENIEQMITAVENNEFEDFYYAEVLEAALITVPLEIRAALKKNIAEDIPIRQIARDSGISRDKLRYWKTHLRKVIKTFLK